MLEKKKIKGEHSLKDKQCPIESRRFRLRSPHPPTLSPTVPLAALRQISHRGGRGKASHLPQAADHTAEPAGLQPPPSWRAPLLALPVSRCSTACLPSGVAFAAADPLQDPHQISPRRCNHAAPRRANSKTRLLQRRGILKLQPSGSCLAERHNNLFCLDKVEYLRHG